MAYELVTVGSVGVQIPGQALRPREPTPSRPPVVPNVGRPRSTPRGNPSGYLRKVAAIKAQQRACEAKLRVLGAQLNRCKAVVTKLKRTNASQRAVASQQARCVGIEKQIAALIEQVKILAGQANQAADAALMNGATREQVRAVAGGVPSKTMTPAITPSLETPGVKVLPGGGLVASGGAVPTETTPAGESVPPSAVAADQEPVVGPQDVNVNVSSGSLFTAVLVAGALGLGYLALRKKGHA